MTDHIDDAVDASLDSEDGAPLSPYRLQFARWVQRIVEDNPSQESLSRQLNELLDDMAISIGLLIGSNSEQHLAALADFVAMLTRVAAHAHALDNPGDAE